MHSNEDQGFNALSLMAPFVAQERNHAVNALADVFSHLPPRARAAYENPLQYNALQTFGGPTKAAAAAMEMPEAVPGRARDADMSTRLRLARTLQAEAGNQGYQGMLDVGSVIMNRVDDGRYGDGVDGVIMKPGQFSAWNSVTGYAKGEQGQNMGFTPREDALRAADALWSGNYSDRTGGATHYYAVIPGVSGVPKWSNDTFRKIDGDHYFGRADAGRKPRPKPAPPSIPAANPHEFLGRYGL